MTDASETIAEPKKSSVLLPILVGLVLAVLSGGGGFLVMQKYFESERKTGVVAVETTAEVAPIGDVTYLPVGPLIVSLPAQSSARHLRFAAQLEVPSSHAHDVENMLPRVIDVLNGYLRALRPADVEGSTPLVKLRSQMLRRVQAITGAARVKDVLVMEFVLN